ncbi:MAG: hypothetical protein ACKON8_10790 [Planctomycetota bacterium]
MTRLVAITVVVGCLAAATPARAQNDWQFPDPYFGILEIEKSRPSGVERRFRAEVAPGSRSVPSRPRPLRPWRRHVRQGPAR